MKVLIIGSKGFIGSHLVNHFALIGNEIVSCDIVTDYDTKNYYVVTNTEIDIHKIFQEHKDIDVCINASGAAQVAKSFNTPISDFQLNTFNVGIILEAIRTNSPSCKYIGLSSAAVYGNPSSLPITERMPHSPVSPYGYHKSMAESLCVEYSTLFGLNTCILRIFSAFGEGLRKQLFWDLYNKLARTKNELPLFGTGMESRDFIYISDLCTIVDLAIHHSTFKAQAINVANGTEITIQEAVQTFIEEFGWKGTINFEGQSRVGDPTNWKADISIINSWGYNQKYSIREGLKNYIEWAKRQESH